MKRMERPAAMALALVVWTAAAFGATPAVADCGKDHGAMAMQKQDKMHEGKEAHHAAMMKKTDQHQLVQHYAAMAKILAQDSTDGLAAHANAVAKSLTSSDEGDKPAMAAQSLATLQQKDVSLEQARTAFKSLSEELVPALAEYFPTDAKSDTKWVVYRCDMASGAWVQPAGEAMNPYYGSEMLHCGKQITVLGTENAAEQLQKAHEMMKKESAKGSEAS